MRHVGQGAYHRTMVSSPVFWTVGHSNHDLERFLDLVLAERIAYLVDVRSYPYSRFAPHFNREELQAVVSQRGVGYLFLGESLGGRPNNDEHYDAEGHALYDRMAAGFDFQQAITRLLGGAKEHRLALMCSCGQPTDCHRRLLVGKVLSEQGAELRHILPDGRVQPEHRVLVTADGAQDSLFGHDAQPWRSAQSVSRRRRLSTSLRG